MAIRIRNLSTSAGYLQNAPVEFSDGLTCIIGARGTCKSTIVETLRFVFNCEPVRVAILLGESGDGTDHDSLSVQGLIRATLGDGQARCEILEDGREGLMNLTIERGMESPPRVYREGIKELSDLSILHKVEIYSQGDLQRIAENDALRLELIDRPHKTVIADLKKKRQTAADSLHALGQQLRLKRADIESRRSDVRGLQALRDQLASVQSQRPTLSKQLDDERESFLRRKSFLDRLQVAVKDRGETLESLLNTSQLSIDLPGLSEEAKPFTLPEADAIFQDFQTCLTFLADQRRTVEALLQTDLAPLLDAIQKRFEERNETYFKLRQEQQEVNDSLKREDAIKQQILHLEKLEKELEKLQQEEQALVRQRSDCRMLVQQHSDRIYRLRLQEVEQINNEHGAVVLLTLDQATRSPGYGAQLATLLQGSRLRAQEDVVRDLIEKVRPSDLIDIIEANDAQRLATVLSRDLGQMARLLAFLADSEDLYTLEGIVFDDRLEITMYDNGVPKPVGQLSKGQMATALLPLILRPADYPLIFDQPEDDLDNRFIFSTLVETIHRLKDKRQLIFVTHNANIPVLGEADRVVVMSMDTPMQAAPPLAGDVDAVKADILTLLEGGADAFRRRQKKYADLLQ